MVHCKDGSMQTGELLEPPFYDKACEIPRGKLVDVPD
jgi:aminomethyltransferase